MMKNFYRGFLILMLFPSLVQAKTTTTSFPSIFPHFGGNPVYNYPGVTASRIIGQSYLQFSGSAFIPVDSISYNYSGGRGGALSMEEMDDSYVNFDESITYAYDPVSASYHDRIKRIQEFNATNKAQKYTCQKWSASMNGFKDSLRYLYTFNSDQTRLQSNNMQIYLDGMWVSHVNYVNDYDANNNLIKTTSITYEWQYSYDASGKLAERLERQRLYVNGAFTAWFFTNRYSFTYDAGGKMETYKIEAYDNGWQNLELHSYTYSGTNLTANHISGWENNAWTPKGLHEFTYDGNGNKLTDVFKYWDASAGNYLAESKQTWVYNNFFQPTLYYSQSWDVAGNSWTYTDEDFMYRYYYQTYSPTAVTPVPGDEIALRLFPQPAQSVLQVAVNSSKTQELSFAIYDVQGRILQQGATKSGVNTFSVPVNELASGNYFIRISNGTSTIAKQFVVSH